MEYLRSYYCPERQDYGVRYLRWDVPAAVAARIDTLYKIASFEDIRAGLTDAARWFEEIEKRASETELDTA